MQQNRSRVVWIAAIAIAFFFFIDPFRLFSGNKVPTMRLDRETETQMAAFVAESASATDTVLNLLQSADVVLIGESGYASQHALFAADLIPVLDSAGIRNFGYEHANTEDQASLDELLTASTFDENRAREILFNNLTVFGFQEHVDILRAAWEVNRRKSSSEQPFRIIALSNRLDYTAITDEDAVEDPEVMHRVFASGIPDQVMARVIAEQFLDRNEKAVAFMHIDHALTGLEIPGYQEQLEELGFGPVQRAGNALRAQYGDRVVTAALHGPVQYSRSQTGFGYPTGGVIERAVDSLDGERTVGFQTASSPFADLEIVSDSLAEDFEEPPTVARYADAWLVVVPVKDLAALTPIPDFITPENLDAAIRNFPGVSPQDATVEDMNEFIAGNADSMERVFAEFK